jgi:hypothetical protein
MKIVIKDNLNALNGKIIIRVKIECDNSLWTPPFQQYPVAGRPTFPGSNGNWLGFASEYVSNPYMEYNPDNQAFRGFIFRGNT